MLAGCGSANVNRHRGDSPMRSPPASSASVVGLVVHRDGRGRAEEVIVLDPLDRDRRRRRVGDERDVRQRGRADRPDLGDGAADDEERAGAVDLEDEAVGQSLRDREPVLARIGPTRATRCTSGRGGTAVASPSGSGWTAIVAATSTQSDSGPARSCAIASDAIRTCFTASSTQPASGNRIATRRSSSAASCGRACSRHAHAEPQCSSARSTSCANDESRVGLPQQRRGCRRAVEPAGVDLVLRLLGQRLGDAGGQVDDAGVVRRESTGPGRRLGRGRPVAPAGGGGGRGEGGLEAGALVVDVVHQSLRPAVVPVTFARICRPTDSAPSSR